MKNKIKKWLGIENEETKLNGIIGQLEEIQKQQLNQTSDLARLMVDLKAGFISWNSFDFVCRMNLSIKNVEKQISLDLVRKINNDK